MKIHLSACVSALSLLLAVCSTNADDRPDHYKGQPSESLEQAIVNLKHHNQLLTETLSSQELTASDLNTIHQITYSLENALEKMASEMQLIQVSLEQLHQISETNAPKKAKSIGRAYLKLSQPLVD